MVKSRCEASTSQRGVFFLETTAPPRGQTIYPEYSQRTSNSRDRTIKKAASHTAILAGNKPPLTLKHLKRWRMEWIYPDPRGDDFIFPSIVGSRPDRTRPISVSYINRIIKNLARKAGVERTVNTYLLRHTRLTEVRKRGVQGIEFNKFAGHTTGSKQEAVYVHLDNEDMKQSVIAKVYNIDEEDLSTKAYEDRIAALEGQLQEVLSYLKESHQAMTATKHTVAHLGKSAENS